MQRRYCGEKKGRRIPRQPGGWIGLRVYIKKTAVARGFSFFPVFSFLSLTHACSYRLTDRAGSWQLIQALADRSLFQE